MKRGRTVALIALGIAAVAGAYRYFYPAATPPQFVTERLTVGDVTATVGATGSLEALTTVQVGTQVSGTIQALHADYNSTVRRGQIIARLDPSLFETQVAQAKANLTKAEADRDRLVLATREAKRKFDQARRLAADGIVTQSDLDTAESNYLGSAAQVRSAEAQLTQAAASLQQAQVSLEKTVIAAPIDGIVIARNVDVGQTVASSLQAPTLFVIAADLTKMRVNASIHEADVGRIRPGQPVRFRVDAFPTEEFPGVVSLVRINPIVQQNVVTYATVIDVPNSALKLMPGMTATVTIQVAARRNVLRAPLAALRFRPSAALLAAVGAVTESAPAAPSAARPRARSQAATDENRAAHGTPTGTAAPAGQLFGPIADPVSTGQLWTYSDGRLTSKRVRVGITDDAYAELVEPDLTEGTPVVTSVVGTSTTTQTNRSTSSTSSNPLMGGARPPGGPRR